MKNKIKKFAADLAYNYTAILAAQLLCLPLSIYYLSLVARSLGPEKFGHLTIFFATAQLFLFTFFNWTRNAIVRFGSENFAREGNVRSIIGTQAAITFTLLCLSLTVIYFLRSLDRRILGLGARGYFWLSLYILSYVACDFIMQLVKAKHMARPYAAALFLRQASILAMLLGVLFFIGKKLDYSNIVLIEAVSYIIVTVVLFYFAFKGRKAIFSFDSSRFRQIMSYSFPILVLTWISYLTNWADIWFLRIFLGYEAVGRFDAANRLAELAANFIIPICVVGGPLVVSLKNIGQEEFVKVFAKGIAPQLAFFWSIFVLVIVVASGYIIPLFFGKTYSASILPFQILSIGLSLQVVPYLYTTILEAYDLTAKMALVTFTCMSVSLTLNLTLIPLMGISGAACARVAVPLVAGLMYYHYASKRLGLKKTGYIFYYLLSLPALAFLCIRALRGPIMHLVVLVVFIFLGVAIAKKVKLFSKESWLFWEKVNMPGTLKIYFKKIYLALG